MFGYKRPYKKEERVGTQGWKRERKELLFRPLGKKKKGFALGFEGEMGRSRRKPFVGHLERKERVSRGIKDKERK